jgi:hypothetical protein
MELFDDSSAVSRHCERSEAIHGDEGKMFNPVILDCFVALLLAMKTEA